MQGEESSKLLSELDTGLPQLTTAGPAGRSRAGTRRACTLAGLALCLWSEFRCQCRDPLSLAWRLPCPARPSTALAPAVAMVGASTQCLLLFALSL